MAAFFNLVRAGFNYLRTAFCFVVVFGAISICAFGNPRTDGGALGALAPFFCTLMGISFVVLAFATPFLRQPFLLSPHGRKGLVLLFGIAGILCVYVGGRWLWSWFA